MKKILVDYKEGEPLIPSSDNSRTARFQRMEDNKAVLYASVITTISQEIIRRYDYPLESHRPKRSNTR